jgi:hypothetical protein
MAKLIFDKGVVQERADLNPVTGCWRVVYEKLGDGARFLQLLDEEEDFQTEKKGIFKTVMSKALASEPEYLTYAVSKQKNLLLEFPQRVVHQNQINHFDLYFRVEYHVSDPKALVVRLRAVKEDLLVKLRDIIGDEVGRVCRRIPWEIVKDEYAFNDMADDLTRPDKELFQRLQNKAGDLGFAITDIRLSLRLLEIDVDEPKKVSEHQRILAKKVRDLQLTQADEDIKDVSKIRALRRERWDGGTRALITSLDKIAGDTDTATKLRETLNDIGSIFDPQMANAPGSEAQSLPESSPRLLSEKTGGPLGKGLSVVQQVVGVVVQLDLREREKRLLLSSIFHLAGALLESGESKPEALEHYQEKYQTVLEQFLHELSTQQHDTLTSLLSIERL